MSFEGAFKCSGVAFFILVLAAATAGCGSSEPEDDDLSISLPGGNSLRLDKDGGEIRMSGEDGVFEMKASDEGVEYPVELEGDFPPCPGCTPVQASNIGGGIGVMLKSSGTPEEAYSFYLEKAKAAGYAIGLENKTEVMNTFIAEKGQESLNCNVGVNDDGSVLVSLQYMSIE